MILLLFQILYSNLKPISMKKTAILLSLLLFICGLALNAQTRQVSGTVTSAEDGLPLPGVSIVVDGLTLGTLSDFEGRYTLDVPANATRLVFLLRGDENTYSSYFRDCCKCNT